MMEVNFHQEVIVKEEFIIEDDFNDLDEEENHDLETEETATNVVVKEELIIEDIEDAFGKLPEEESPKCNNRSKIYPCGECGRKFKVLELFQSHVQRHENIRLGMFRCTVCEKLLGGARDLRIHIRMNHRTWRDGEKRNCRHCGREFPDLKGFQCHVAWHKRRGLYRCSTCGENLISTDTSDSHECRVAHIQNGEFQCDICSEFLGGKAELQKHKRLHRSQYMKAYQECDKDLGTPTAYNVHVSRHIKDSRGSIHCPLCDKNFATKGRLKFHKCHPRELPKPEENSPNSDVVIEEELIIREDVAEDDSAKIMHRCEECGKRFSKEVLYRSHLERHENIRHGTFRCPTCHQCQGSKRDLSEHIRDFHKPIPEWMQTCRECGRSEFSTSNSYRAHMTRHKNMRKGTYKCEACNRVGGIVAKASF